MDEVERLVVESPFTEEERRNAHRSLSRGSLASVGGPEEQMVSLFCALRRVKGPSARINASMLQQWKTKYEQSTKVKTCFWVVPAESPALTRADVKQFIVPPEDLAEIPPGLLEQQVVFVDQVVERSKLGTGPAPTPAVPNERQNQQTDPSQAVPQAEDTKEVVTQTSAAPSQVAGRILRRVSSEAETEENTAEQIAQEIKSAFSAGRISSLDPLDSTCATFWWNAYTKDILLRYKASGKEAADFVKDMDPCSQAVVKFTVKALLETDALSHLSVFVNQMKALKEALPGFLPSLAEALVYMNGLKEAEATVDFAFLPLTQQRLLFNSKLYGAFVTQRAGQMLEKEMSRVRRGEPCDRELLTGLMNGPAGETLKKDLTFALSWFAPMSLEDRVKWLLSSVEHFDLLSKWCPEADVAEGDDTDGRKMKDLQFCLDKALNMEKIGAEQLLCVVSLLQLCPSALQSIAHAGFKMIVKDYVKLVAAAGDEVALRDLAKAWLFEACSVKLGMPEREVTLADLSAMGDQVQAMASIFGKHGPGAHGVAHTLLLKAQETRTAEESKKEKAANETKPEPTEAVLPEAPESDVPGADVAIGDVVITTAKKFKDSLHDQKGKIVGILSKQYKIEMLTGTALGEIKKFDKTAVRKEESQKADPKDTAPGDEKRPAETPVEAEPDAKRLRSEDKAKELFGDDNLDEIK